MLNANKITTTKTKTAAKNMPTSTAKHSHSCIKDVSKDQFSYTKLHIQSCAHIHCCKTLWGSDNDLFFFQRVLRYTYDYSLLFFFLYSVRFSLHSPQFFSHFGWISRTYCCMSSVGVATFFLEHTIPFPLATTGSFSVSFSLSRALSLCLSWSLYLFALPH